MSASQARLDRLAAHGIRLFGDTVELVTYHARSTATAAVVDHVGLVVHFENYRHHDIDGMQILKEDERCRIQTALVTWTPTIYDRITRPDGTLWQVMAPSRGRGDPWYMLQTRKVS